MQSSSKRLLFNEPLSRYTRIGTGGPVSLLAFAYTVEDVRDIVTLSRDRGWPCMVLGKGSNIVTPDEEADELAFGYRTSCLALHSMVILEAVFRLPPETVSAAETLSALRSRLQKRYSAQPRCFRTFGSTFKNPSPSSYSAGWYLEKVGMRGVRQGGAMVAREHANWIINTGGATTADIVELMRVGRKRVFEEFGLDLQQEVIVVPGTLHVPPV